MLADRKWIKRNLGYDLATKPLPTAAYTFAKAAHADATIEDIEREIIDFDS